MSKGVRIVEWTDGDGIYYSTTTWLIYYRGEEPST